MQGKVSVQGRQRALKASQQIRNCETGEFLDSLPIKLSLFLRVMFNIKVHFDTAAGGSDRCNLRCYALQSPVAGQCFGTSFDVKISDAILHTMLLVLQGFRHTCSCAFNWKL
jgi:hypothetical protein